MKIRSTLKLFIALFAIAGLPLMVSGCDTVVDDDTVAQNLPPQDVQVPPPQEVQVEMIPVLQNPQSEIWRSGYWAMINNTFVWVPGRVIARPSPTAAWRPAHWVQHVYGWSFEQGHWE